MKKYFVVLISITMLLLLSFSFYWFQLRPAHIREECSWVKKHSDFIPAITQEQVDVARAKCASSGRKYGVGCSLSVGPERPAMDWYEPASPSEYQFCIHSHGL